MANRRISEFPAISGGEIDEQDLLTLVHVFEVDPTLRNKKITFTQFKEYLNKYYAPASGATFSGNVTISGNLTVSGTSSFNSITTSGSSTFSGIVVQNNAVVSGTVSGNAGLFTFITGDTLRVTTPSGATPAIVCSGVVSGSASGFVIQGPLIILP